MLEVCRHKMIPMPSKACSTFSQVHQIALFTSLTADQTNLIDSHKFVRTLLAEDMTAGTKCH
ncbi:hypothetical protein OIU79_023096 [Salix purpurea]|uniref:Uncharacterized protein n=1 Tax=Salix purpurea TaxID=77065 RepID=A0A9Q1ADB9_SALPP|nr:hypothetical protein OIU79_023096 [Salix purpurea]